MTRQDDSHQQQSQQRVPSPSPQQSSQHSSQRSKLTRTNAVNAHMQPYSRKDERADSAYRRNEEYLKQVALQNAKWFPKPPDPVLPAAPAPSKSQKAKAAILRPLTKINYKSWATSLSSLMLLAAIGGGVTGAGWLSVQFLLNPRSVIWVNNYLPEPLQLKIAGWDQPRTMREITSELTKSGLWLGDQIRLTSDHKKSEFVVPVFQNREDCVEDCQQISELRVYRPVEHPYRKTKEQHFQMVSQLPVLGMEDWFVQEPFVNAQVDVPPPSAAILSFDGLELLSDQAPKEGVWLTLKGERDQVGLYGQILHYNPRKFTLTAMVPWTSPARELPTWENITLGGSPELVVDQTIGMEPRYQVYLLEPERNHLSGLKLRALSLTKPVLEARAYMDALKLAKSGLWSLAVTAMDSLGDAVFKDNSTAQLQRDVMRYHAQIFKAQAEQASANTSQQVLSELLDGRWEKAIKTAKASPDDREDVIELLNSDAGQLLRRLAAAMEIDPGNPALQSWNAAMKLARSGKASAIAWLKTQPQNGDRNKMLADLAPNLSATPKPSPSPVSEVAPSPAPAAAPSSSPEPLPTAIPVGNEQPWLQTAPNPPIEAAPRAVDALNQPSDDPLPPLYPGR
jgi:hypothetical protein